MIVVDSSALLAVLLKEPEKQAFQDIIAVADRCVLSAVNAHETATVLRIRHGRPAVERLWQLLADNAIEVFPFDEPQVRMAAQGIRPLRQGHPLQGTAESVRLCRKEFYESPERGAIPPCAAVGDSGLAVPRQGTS